MIPKQNFCTVNKVFSYFNFNITLTVHSMAKANLNKSELLVTNFYRSIKAHTYEAQNLHQLKIFPFRPNFTKKYL